MNTALLAGIIGGLLIGFSKIVSDSAYIGPAYASLLGGLPTGLIAGYFMSRNNQKKFFIAYLIDALVTVGSIFIIGIYMFNNYPTYVYTILILFWFVWLILMVIILEILQHYE